MHYIFLCALLTSSSDVSSTKKRERIHKAIWIAKSLSILIDKTRWLETGVNHRALINSIKVHVICKELKEWQSWVTEQLLKFLFIIKSLIIQQLFFCVCLKLYSLVSVLVMLMHFHLER